ncbi:MAG: arylesterase [Alphaproteobacteria bacterium]|nr:arylesterase [Alphaproteobacteria bacterium]
MLALLNPATVRAGGAPAPAGGGKTVLAFGDSITAGYGLNKTEALPAQLQALFEAKGQPVTVINAGVSGETTAGGLRRLEWTLKKHNPDYVILALGGNDMLRAIDPRSSLQNLQQMMEILKAYKKPVLIAGMRAPESMGPSFSKGYDLMYSGLAKDYGAGFYPFILDGVAQNPALNLRDGVHPNAQGVAVIAQGMYPYVLELLKK